MQGTRGLHHLGRSWKQMVGCSWLPGTYTEAVSASPSLSGNCYSWSIHFTEFKKPAQYFFIWMNFFRSKVSKASLCVRLSFLMAFWFRVVELQIVNRRHRTGTWEVRGEISRGKNGWEQLLIAFWPVGSFRCPKAQHPLIHSLTSSLVSGGCDWLHTRTLLFVQPAVLMHLPFCLFTSLESVECIHILLDVLQGIILL